MENEKANERGLIIAVINEKGGAGKSTICINIAAELASKEAKIHILDTDPQGSASEWVDLRNDLIESDSSIPVIHCTQKHNNIKPAVIEISQHSDVLIVDTSGRDSRAARLATIVADIIIMPVEASFFNLRALEKTIEILNETYDMNPERKVKILFNKTSTNIWNNSINEAKEYLSSIPETVEFLISHTKSREAYKKAERNGLGVIEMNDHKAKNEIKNIVAEIIKNDW